MAKLYYRFGTVSCGKTLALLAVAHKYERQGKIVVVVKPAVNNHGHGIDTVRSRAGLERKADIVVRELADLGDRAAALIRESDCVLVDESQFLPPDAIDWLRLVAVNYDVPVIAWGLRTDFRRRVFPASQRLFELADVLEEVKTVCTFCRRRAVFSAWLEGRERLVLEGDPNQAGADDLTKFQPLCPHCFERLAVRATA